MLARDAELERKREKPDAAQEDANRSRRRRIRCPKCAWQPRPEDRWSCSCAFVWNTFDTAGLCPGCGYQWPWTQCLRCGQPSPHKDWYEDAPRK